MRNRLTVFAAVWLAGCLLPNEPVALEASITATPSTAAVDQDVDFVINARGAGVHTILMEFGDTSDETFFSGGADNVKTTFPHRYAAPGTYIATATVSDTRTSKQVTTTVTIQ